MAETPQTPEPQTDDDVAAEPVAAESTAAEPADIAEPAPPASPSLEQVLAEALDEDDLPQPSHPGPSPEPAVLERPATQAVPGIAATIDIPPSTAGADATGTGTDGPGSPASGAAGSEAGGGEWELLVGKISHWFGSGELQRQWDRLRGPLRGVAYLLGLVLALRVYASVVGTLDALPLIGGLLELVGLIAFSRFCLTRLLKTSEREKVISDWRQRWNDFSGRGGA